MKIVQLKVSNVQRCVAVEINHPADIVVLGGENEQGKTSILDALEMAIGGAEAVPAMPLRRGAEKGHTICTLADVDDQGNEIPETAIVAERRFKAGGPRAGTFVLRAADGTPQKAPQRMLATLIGRKAFDPLEFERMKPADQYEALRRLVGLDLTSLDEERAKAYGDRRIANAEAKKLNAQIGSFDFHTGAPKEEVSIAGLTDDLDTAVNEQARVGEMRRDLDELARRKGDQLAERTRIEGEIEALVRKRDGVDMILQRYTSEASEREAQIMTARDQARDPGPIRVQLMAAEEVNRKVRSNILLDSLVKLEAKEKIKAREADEEIERLDEQKRELIAAAEMPVEGLSLDAGQVLLDGVPLEQASTAELRRLSIAMGFALNPQFPLVSIRDASLFDERSYKMVCQMAAERKGLLWMERVAVDGKTTIEIREGKIVEKGGNDGEENAENS